MWGKVSELNRSVEALTSSSFKCSLIWKKVFCRHGQVEISYSRSRVDPNHFDWCSCTQIHNGESHMKMKPKNGEISL